MNENDLVRPNSDYAFFKAASTLFCQQESIINKLPIITVRPFHVYGPYEDYKGKMSSIHYQAWKYYTNNPRNNIL